MQDYFKTIIDTFEGGGSGVSIIGPFGKGGVGRLAKQIKAVAKGRDVVVKDMTSYYYGHTPKSKREECRKFLNLVEDAAFRPLKPVHIFREDGTFGVKLIPAPFCVMIINCETIEKIRQKRELSLLSRLNKPSRFKYDPSEFAKVKERLYALSKHEH